MTAEEWHALQVEKVIILQCFFRQVLSIMKVKKLRATHQIRVAHQNEVFNTCTFNTRGIKRDPKLLKINEKMILILDCILKATNISKFYLMDLKNGALKRRVELMFQDFPSRIE
jgi:hypothetical protein